MVFVVTTLAWAQADFAQGVLDEAAVTSLRERYAIHQLASSKRIEGLRLYGCLSVVEQLAGIPTKLRLTNPLGREISVRSRDKSAVFGGTQQLYFEFFDPFLDEWRSVHQEAGFFGPTTTELLKSGGSTEIRIADGYRILLNARLSALFPREKVRLRAVFKIEDCVAVTKAAEMISQKPFEK